METRRLAVVSNRLPIVLKQDANAQWSITSASGGLVTALGPVLRNRGGMWIGWLGSTSESLSSGFQLKQFLQKGNEESGYTLEPVELTEEELRKYYFGFSNEILWPLFHDMPTRCNFDPEYWGVYKQVNQKFARAVLAHTAFDDYVWVHDYQLILVAMEIKKLGEKRHCGFFLHIPFPPLDVFLKLPWRFQLLDALMQYDLVGFQTVRDRRNFIECIQTLTPGAKIFGSGHVCKLTTGKQEIRLGTFPISIDYQGFADLAGTKEVADEAWIIHQNLPNRQLILGIDRLDYTKGIPNRLMAFAAALKRYPQMRKKITLIQVVVPSRGNIREYNLLKQEIERLVGEINGQFTEVGWTPIIYMYRSLSRSELVAYYRTCEIALITPLKDGMNLVAKEYCASNVDENGVLILSEFAGAAAQLHQAAILVNPFDIEAVAEAIYRAFTMAPDERKTRMQRLRRSIARQNVFHWVKTFLRAGIENDLSSFPLMELFVPRRAKRSAMNHD
ncbi:alpha,alpha-trehalose-phosphate synthase (UDP-forming) [Desulfatirhabdium butyrativorans]|uniref:alpha,alpha-trehalose-phosphate synthase (UDP-forming) n=1 Tax=Desulfatirhabdium butyrativorans TaxID=340467 RepID=UPI0004162A8A|nr:trehalose-6-phosphate synthase [Desulfatirhabdium butyrativorans]